MSPPEPRRSPRLVEKKVSLHMSEAPPPPLASAPCGEESKSETPTVLSKYFNMFAPVILIGAGCLHAVIQEQLMHDLSHVPLLITSFEFGCCAVLSLIMLMVRRDDPFNAPRLSLLRISLLVLASLVSGNVALKYVSYPVKVSVAPTLTPRTSQAHLLSPAANSSCEMPPYLCPCALPRAAGRRQVMQTAADDGPRQPASAQALLAPRSARGPPALRRPRRLHLRRPPCWRQEQRGGRARGAVVAARHWRPPLCRLLRRRAGAPL